MQDFDEEAQQIEEKRNTSVPQDSPSQKKNKIP